MHKQIIDYGGRYRMVNEYIADKKQTTIPALIELTTFKDGKLFYHGISGQLYEAVQFDRIFGKPKAGMKEE